MSVKTEKKIPMRRQLADLRRAVGLIGRFPSHPLVFKTIATVVGAALPFFNLYFSAQIVGELAGGRDSRRLTFLVLLTIGLNLAVSLVRAVLSRWSEYRETDLWMSMYRVNTDKLYDMDYADLENPAIQKQYAELSQHMQGMGFGLPALYGQYEPLLRGGIQIVLSVVLAFSLFSLPVPDSSPLAFLNSPAADAVVALVLLGSVLLAPYLSAVGDRILAKISELNNRFHQLWLFYHYDMLQDLWRAKDVRVYRQSRLVRRGLDQIGDIMGDFTTASRYNGKYRVLSTAVSYTANGLIYLFVALKALGGAFGVGSIVQYAGAAMQFGDGCAAVLGGLAKLFNNNAFLEKAYAFLDIPNNKYQGTLSVEKRDDNAYEIEFHNVSFKYPGSDAYALRNLDLKLRVGRRMAVVGMNGSGKTTMIKLLCRLYDPTEGSITLNGIDIRKYNYREYMDLFGIVFQDFALLTLPLAENVAGGVTYDEDRVRDCLDKAGFSERLASMPDGVHTYLYKAFEESGVDISGGEAQKIALARALYRSAPFIVLDEPTAALDPVAEYDIYSRFNEIVGDRTAIYISHRLSSCRFCDDIAVFHEGRLIQRGGHEALLADTAGKYAELWHAQAQYYVNS